MADEVALVQVGENWRYFKGVSEPAQAWRELAFDDSDWLLGISGFATRYGGEATPLPDMPDNYLSVYFRKTFSVTDPEQVQWLTFRADYNDGFVVYLNGQEIARRNMPGPSGSKVSFDAPATTFHARAAVEEIDVSPFAHLLNRGTNLLAIQAHNTDAFDFDFGLVPELLANFTRGPFLQNASSNSIQIIWKTVLPADTALEYGTNSSPGLLFSSPALSTNHVVTLTNLLPGMTYYYRARSSRGRQTATSPLEVFRTLKTAGSLSFVVLGDSGAGSREQFQIARVMQEAKPDLVLHAGDVIYPIFIPSLVDTRCLSVYGAHMKNTPYYFAFGNHDLYSGAQHFLDAFYLPTNSVPAAQHLQAGTSPEHYYSFDHGDAHFTVLFVPYFNQYRLRAGDPQYKWFTNDLASSSQPWKFLLLHLPMESSSYHRSDDYDSNGIADRLDLKELILPAASRYGVQLVFSGHEHVYERFNPTNGVYSIVSGGGGGGLYGLAQLDLASALFWVRHHCVKVTIEGDIMETHALGLDGEAFDSMTIQRGPPSPKVYAAAWHTPLVESAPGADPQGNISGQTFDLKGTAIPAVTGQFSNLGRAFVNNDQTNLYVGLDRVMIYGNNNVFLVIESPRLPGVTNLLGVGNGVMDPQGQGADGLDFLANLSFTNFAPSVGCILGDAFGDGQFRNFFRATLPLNIGQGIFKLEADLGDVRGVRLQQFNLPPQAGGATSHPNASHIEVAIPLSELGGLQAGDSIKIGAVVAGEGTDPQRQERSLDSGFLGDQWINSGQNSMVLQGLEVRLAHNPDADNDSLLDAWEVEHGLNPLSANGEDGGNGDPDADDFTNAQEQIAGTHPRDPQSALRVRLETVGKQRYALSWPAAIGRRYQIQFTDNPLKGFFQLRATGWPKLATTTNLVYEENLPEPLPGTRFYRILVVPPPD